MKVGILGGLLMGGLLGVALLGLAPGCILIGLGAAYAALEAAREQQAEKQAASWRRNYPSYKY